MKIADRIKKLPNEVIGNLILIGFLICGLLASVICAYLNRTKVFYLALSNKAIIYILAFQSLAITAIFVSLIITELSVLRNHLFKYILLYLVFIWVGINCTVVYFHSTLLLLIPLIISRCYNSRKMTIRAIYLTIILIIVTPLLAYKLDGMDISFPLWYVSILNNKLGGVLDGVPWLPEGQFSANIIPISPYLQLCLWVVLPRLITVFGLILVSMAGNYASRQSYKSQLEHILSLQDSMIDLMAEVIENRDMSTGGHVRRTQDNMKILVSNVRKDFDMPDEYWNDVIKSSAMHDLGKIAICDEILNKPGKLTLEEFEKIKLHPEKSKSIIDKLFEKEDDELLKKTASNIALYHHEKYDGSGYPKGLKGDNIPLEARIMALADVYDALVSDRVYKKAYSFEEAYEIIKETMGSHFDPKLWRAFEKSAPMLEAHYRNLD